MIIGPLKLNSSNLEQEIYSFLSKVGPQSELVGLVHRDTGEFYLSDSLTVEEMEKLKRDSPLLPLSDMEVKRKKKQLAFKHYITPSNMAFGVLVNDQKAREAYFITKSERTSELEKYLTSIELIINKCQAQINLTQQQTPQEQPADEIKSTAVMKEEKPTKPKVMLFVNVYKDGTGDFSHFEDFYKNFINDERYKGYEFIPVISCAVEQFDKIQNRLKKLNIPKNYFFKDEIERLDKDEELNKDLREARQILLISNIRFPYLNEYLKRMNCAAVRKFLGEHEAPLFQKSELLERIKNSTISGEATQEAKNYVTKKWWHGYSMGLFYSGVNGLKFNTDIDRCSTADALTAIKEDKGSEPFVEALLSRPEVGTLIPAYFNVITPLARFIQFYNMHDDPTKNLSIYFSGCEMGPAAIEELKKGLQNTSIKQVEIIKPGQEAEIINCSASQGKVVRIYCGFNLGNDSYKKLYAQAPIAAISGDNTLEMAISNGAFPFYHSTNYKTKFTLQGLCENIIPRVNIFNNPWEEVSRLKRARKFIEAKELEENYLRQKAEESQIKSDYLFYFGNLSKFNTELTGELKARYEQLNFARMIEHWPTVVNYLVKHYNYYDKLPKIFFEDLPQPRKDNPAVLPDVSVQSKTVGKEPVEVSPEFLGTTTEESLHDVEAVKGDEPSNSEIPGESLVVLPENLDQKVVSEEPFDYTFKPEIKSVDSKFAHNRFEFFETSKAPNTKVQDNSVKKLKVEIHQFLKASKPSGKIEVCAHGLLGEIQSYFNRPAETDPKIFTQLNKLSKKDQKKITDLIEIINRNKKACSLLPDGTLILEQFGKLEQLNNSSQHPLSNRK